MAYTELSIDNLFFPEEHRSYKKLYKNKINRHIS